MAIDELHVTFEGPKVGDIGVPLDDLQKTLNHLQKAIWLMVSHLEGATTPRGRPPAWVRRGSTLRLMRTSPGSLVAELGVTPLVDYRASGEDPSQTAIDLIMKRQPEVNSSLPMSVADELMGIGKDLSPDVTVVRVSAPNSDNHMDIPRKEREERGLPVAPVTALLYGWLIEVDWDSRSARLHRHGDRPVLLRFNASLDEDMHRLARQYVEVRGHGRFNKNDQWAAVQIQQISGTDSWREPFDIEAFWNNPTPKIFDPAETVRASEPFDVDEFIRITREGRDA